MSYSSKMAALRRRRDRLAVVIEKGLGSEASLSYSRCELVAIEWAIDMLTVPTPLPSSVEPLRTETEE